MLDCQIQLLFMFIIDIDECLGEEKVCTGEHEKCVNTIGSNSCVCKKGYGRRGNKCELRKKGTCIIFVIIILYL